MQVCVCVYVCVCGVCVVVWHRRIAHLYRITKIWCNQLKCFATNQPATFLLYKYHFHHTHKF